jgi:dihydroorotate dehydrogenase electron transfer subunit
LVFPIKLDPRRIVRIEDAQLEAENIKTILFKDRRCAGATPGQYAMLWIPGVDEIPMSLSKLGRGGLCGVTVEAVGEATAALHRMRAGEVLGVRGPFGNGFTPTAGKALLVAGGVGLAPLLPLAEQIKASGGDATIIYGAKTSPLLFGLARARSIVGERKLLVATEDGSFGTKGLVTDLLYSALDVGDFSAVYCCGPEPMMRKVFEAADAKGIPVQASLERVVRCSIGICGSCMVGGYRLCLEGPVFSSEQLRGLLDEFGKYNRGFDGSHVHYGRRE